MAGVGEIVQKPMQTCDKHSSDEVEVYCKDCSIAICFECSRIHHHDHECESISKLSRTLRQHIPELCKDIRDGTLSRMQAELESIQALQIRNKKLHEDELNSIELLQERCIQTVKNAFKTKVETFSKKLCKNNEKLNARKQELIQKITHLNVHVQTHEDSQLTYGKYEIIEMDEKLKEMTRGFDKMDLKESEYIPFTPSHLSTDFMERLESCMQNIHFEFSEGKSRRNRQFKPSSESPNITATLKNLGWEEQSVVTPKRHAQPARRMHHLTMTNSDSSNFSSAIKHSVSTENSVAFYTAEGILVKVYSASITRLSVDCIVNAANEDLMHGVGVAYAISNAAGYDFSRESRDYIQKYGPIPVGNCCTTGAGNLPYKCVIHTVGPRWSDYNDKGQCEKDLQQAVEVTFREAVHQGCDSIAVPAISSGIFGVPKDVCVKQYYKAIVSYSQSAVCPIKEIHFVDKDQRMVDCIIKNFKGYFSSDKSLETSISDQQSQGHSSNTNQQGQGHKSFSNQQGQGHSSVSNQQGQGHKSCSNQQGHGHSSVSNQQDLSLSTKTYSSVVQSNNNNQNRMSSGSSDEEMAVFEIGSSITVRISVGDIIKVEAEAIVCPQDAKCQNKGGVAKAIHNVAENIYKPGEEVRLSQMKLADVAVLKTKDSIKWQYIFHTIPPWWHYNNANNSEFYDQNLGYTYKTILHKAKEFDVQSLAVPVLGFGESGFKNVIEKNSVIFPEELDWFTSRRNQKKKDYKLDVHIVCTDKSVLSTLAKGFEKKFKRSPLGSVAQEDSVQDDDLNKTMRPPSIMEPVSIDKVEGTCVICMDDFTDPQKLKKCGHIFCKDCIEQYFSGYKPSCPNCGVIYGKIMGNQPEGRMTIAKDRVRLPGYESCTSIKVTYIFLGGEQGPDHPSPGTPYKGFTRSGYLPDNTEGRLVAKLLNVAFTRKLVITIGRSRTTDQDGVLMWNDIDHKTRTHGGTDRFGYPDPTYIERVIDELSVKGVTEESADDPSEYTEYSKMFYK